MIEIVFRAICELQVALAADLIGYNYVLEKCRAASIASCLRYFFAVWFMRQLRLYHDKPSVSGFGFFGDIHDR